MTSRQKYLAYQRAYSAKHKLRKAAYRKIHGKRIAGPLIRICLWCREPFDAIINKRGPRALTCTSECERLKNMRLCRQHRILHLDEYKARDRAYTIANLAKKMEYNRKWLACHREHVRARERAYTKRRGKAWVLSMRHRYLARHPEAKIQMAANVRKCARRQRRNLENGYIVQVLAGQAGQGQSRLKAADFPAELLEIKRKQLELKRLLRERNNGHHKEHGGSAVSSSRANSKTARGKNQPGARKCDSQLNRKMDLQRAAGDGSGQNDREANTVSLPATYGRRVALSRGGGKTRHASPALLAHPLIRQPVLQLV